MIIKVLLQEVLAMKKDPVLLVAHLLVPVQIVAHQMFQKVPMTGIKEHLQTVMEIHILTVVQPV